MFNTSPFRNLLRPITALALAASLTLTPVGSRPAMADNDDVAAFIAALIAMGVIGAVINNNSGGQAPVYHDDDNPGRAGDLPVSCLKTYETRFGTESFFASRCLKRTYHYSAGLPDNCKLTIRVRGRNDRRSRRTVYEPRCLYNEGYRIARYR